MRRTKEDSSKPEGRKAPSDDRFARFVPGSYVAMAGAETLLLVDLKVDSDAAVRLQQGVYEGVPVDELLELVTGLGLRQLPSLAIVRREDQSLRVIVRGSFIVRAWGNDGDRTIEAIGVRTWAEHLLDGYDGVELSSLQESIKGVFSISHGTVPAAAIGWMSPADLATEKLRPVDIAAPPIFSDLAPPVLEKTLPDPPEVSVVDPSATMIGIEESFPSEHVAVEEASIDDAHGMSSFLAALPAPHAHEHPDDYDHLFGATRHITVEQAAVRFDEHGELVGSPSVANSTPPALISRATPMPDLLDQARPATGPSVIMSQAGHPKVVPPPAGIPGMIDGVPGMSTALTPAPTLGWPSASPPNFASGVGGDHDGMTVSSAELARLAGRTVASVEGQAAIAGPSVQAVYCPTGHANPPTAPQCRVCHQPMATANAVTIPRPSLGVLRMSSGSNVSIDRPLIIGRSPKLSGQVGSEVPHLVTVPSPDQAVSRNHVEIRLDGWHVMVVDLNSMNGTTVRLVGQVPQKLTPGSPFPIGIGAVVDMGGGVTCTYEAM